jgi:hypothetical protein
LIIACSKLGLHRSQDCPSKAFFVSQPIGATLDDSYLAVQPPDQAERHLVLRLAVSRNAVPVSLDHFGKPLVWLQTLPLQARAPVLNILNGHFSLGTKWFITVCGGLGSGHSMVLLLGVR